MSGGDKSTAELVRGTQKGILVTRTWYIRMVDPQTVLLTGLTRDGTFYIENGQIKHPVKNFRFNESPVIMLNNIEELGKPVRVAGDESSYVMMIPPMKLRDSPSLRCPTRSDGSPGLPALVGRCRFGGGAASLGTGRPAQFALRLLVHPPSVRLR